MSEPERKPSPEEAEERFRALLRENEMPEPDAVEHDPAAEELIFLWHEQKLAVVIELSEDGPREAMSREQVA